MDIKKLAKALEDAKIPLNDWFEKCSQINEVINQNDGLIDLNWTCSDMDGWVEVLFYSNKIRHTIIISSDANRNYSNYEEMATDLTEYNQEAKELEERLPALT